MYQQNLRYKTKREVRRRPRFVSAQDVRGESKRYTVQSFNEPCDNDQPNVM